MWISKGNNLKNLGNSFYGTRVLNSASPHPTHPTNSSLRHPFLCRLPPRGAAPSNPCLLECQFRNHSRRLHHSAPIFNQLRTRETTAWPTCRLRRRGFRRESIMADSTVPATAAGCSRLCWCHQQVELTRSAPVSHPFPPSLLVIPRACRRHANRPCLPRVRTLSEAALVCVAQEHRVTRSRGASLSSVSAGLSSFVNVIVFVVKTRMFMGKKTPTT